jgi:hypothetical protein
MRRLFARLTVVVCALALAAPAIAYVCHPDPAGTRSLSLHGRVVAYTLSGNTVTIALSSGGACTVFAWRAGKGNVASNGTSCGAVTKRSHPPAAPARVRLVTAGDADKPDRIDVLAPGGRAVRSWPLPVRARPGTLQVSRGLAAFVVHGRSGLWVMRLSDGRFTFVGPVRQGDRPLLNTSGAVYEDNAYKRRPADRPLLKFVPTRTLQHELAQVGRPLHTLGPVRSFSMDGTRVALVVAGGADHCDRVVFWDIPWRSADQVSETRGPTCASFAASRRISAVALGGARAQWVTLHRGRPMLVAADDIGCQEWVIRRLSDLGRGISLAGIAADGPTLAFALVNRSPQLTVSDVGRVTGAYRADDVFRVHNTARSVSVDSRRIAVLAANGSIDVRTEDGTPVRSFVARDATSLALSGNTLAATTGNGRLLVYSVSTGRRLNSWALPPRAGHVDLQYGVAVVTAGRSVYAINVASGRTVRLAMAPVAPRAQIEPIGVVYAYSTDGRGTAKFVPMSRVESAVR